MKRFAFPVLFLCFLFFDMSAQEKKPARFAFIFTSNLEGRFSSEKSDPDSILSLYSAIKKARSFSEYYYYDLGNALYPGTISKFSFGSAMMDYFTYSGCRGSLVSSKDLTLGADNLSVLSQGGKSIFMSSNIVKNDIPVFRPYDVIESNGKKIGIIALSNSWLVLDVAEKNALGISMRDVKKSVEASLAALESEGVTSVILFSGLDFRAMSDVVSSFPQIKLVVSGGDGAGQLLNGRISRVDFADGRSCIYLPSSGGYYNISVVADENISVENIKFVPVQKNLQEKDIFVSRINLWKEHFSRETGGVPVDTAGRNVAFDSTLVGNMLRDRYNSEISILRNPVNSLLLSDGMLLQNVISEVNDLYQIFTYELTGAEIKTVIAGLENVSVTGKTGGKIQGYDISDKTFYRVVSTQPVMEELERILRRKITYRNSWRNISEEISEDLSGRRTLLREGFAYLDSRFRTTANLALSFFMENAGVKKGEDISTPSGRSSKSYKKKGTEDKVEINFYNDLHRITLTPYIYYIKQDEEYLQNILRGTLLYSYNMHDIFKPYNKLQIDSQLVKTEGLRPSVLRETAGTNIEKGTFTARVGGGFEKEIKDPVGPNTYGFELILKYSVEFLPRANFSFNMDSFTSYNPKYEEENLKGYSRVNIESVLSYSIVQSSAISLKYRWFNLYSFGYKQKYRNTQLIVAFDYKTDFKIW